MLIASVVKSAVHINFQQTVGALTRFTMMSLHVFYMTNVLPFIMVHQKHVIIGTQAFCFIFM